MTDFPPTIRQWNQDATEYRDYIRLDTTQEEVEAALVDMPDTSNGYLYAEDYEKWVSSFDEIIRQLLENASKGVGDEQ